MNILNLTDKEQKWFDYFYQRVINFHTKHFIVALAKKSLSTNSASLLNNQVQQVKSVLDEKFLRLGKFYAGERVDLAYKYLLQFARRIFYYTIFRYLVIVIYILFDISYLITKNKNFNIYFIIGGLFFEFISITILKYRLSKYLYIDTHETYRSQASWYVREKNLRNFRKRYYRELPINIFSHKELVVFYEYKSQTPALKDLSDKLFADGYFGTVGEFFDTVKHL